MTRKTTFFLFALLTLAGCAADDGAARLRLGDDCVPSADGDCLPPEETCVDGDEGCPDDPPTVVACGGDFGDTCTDGFFCRFEAGTCGATGGEPGCGGDGDGDPEPLPPIEGDPTDPARGGVGICTRIPDACPDIWLPVCSCDGVTYANECDAAAAGASVAHEGECQRGQASCAPMEARGEGSCDRVLGWAWDGNGCVSLSGCECVGEGCGQLYGDAGECEAEHGHCPPAPAACTIWCEDGFYPDGRGCAPVPTVCTDEVMPVCGCDGIVYSNGCEAHAAGVEITDDAHCEEPHPGTCASDADCGAGEVCAECWGALACIPAGADC